MKFVLLIYVDEALQETSTKEERNEVYAKHGALFEQLKADNAFVAGEEFKASSTAVTVRTGKSGIVLVDGPVASGKEQLGGFYLIEAPDLPAALNYAKRLPGTSEVRPIEVFGSNS